MRTRPLGRTGLSVSELTLGTGSWAAPGSDRAGLRDTAAAAFAGGINAVELAADDAVTVAVLADALGSAGEAAPHLLVRLTSLVPFDLPSPHVPADRAYPGHHLRAQAEALLRALAVDRLGVVQVHAWCPEWLGEGDWLETLARLRDEGKIAGIGISLFDHDVDAALNTVAAGAIDVVQVMLNPFDPSALRSLLPLCQRHGVGVIARSPFYFGALAGDGGVPDYPPGDWRHAYFFAAHCDEVDARIGRMRQDPALAGDALGALALRFAASHPAVATVATGMRSRTQVERNCAAITAGPLDPARFAALGTHAWLC